MAERLAWCRPEQDGGRPTRGGSGGVGRNEGAASWPTMTEGLEQLRAERDEARRQLGEEQKAHSALRQQHDTLQRENERLKRELAGTKSVTPTAPRATETAPLHAAKASLDHLDKVLTMGEQHLTRLDKIWKTPPPTPAATLEAAARSPADTVASREGFKLRLEEEKAKVKATKFKADEAKAATARQEAQEPEPEPEQDAQQHQDFEAQARRHFAQVDRGGNECLDAVEIRHLLTLLGIEVGTQSDDALLTEMLDPDGTQTLAPYDMLVDFDEFLQWYRKRLTK